MFKRNYADKNEASTKGVRETSPHFFVFKPSMGCVRETPNRKVKPAQDV